ncbi:MAG: 2-dehydropantoate 2-reductase [SAR324 cluster bacterium]|nr:2-dehydropantoate 2-reductase [SAR324 cluster bacterium]
MSSSKKVLVLGAGAVGALYGGFLHKAGVDVSVTCRSDYEHVKQQGFQIDSCLGNFNFQPTQVVRKPEDYSGVPDYVIVATKVLPDADVSSLLRPVVGPDTVIVLLQNGIDIEPPVAQAFPENLLISGLAFVCSNRIGPGHIHHQDYGRLIIGAYPGGSHQAVLELSEWFKQAGINCVASENIISARWKKLVWNAPYNPVSVLGGCLDTSQIMESTEAVLLVKHVMEEVCLLASHEGHPQVESVIEQNLVDTRNMVPYRTSMLLDYEAGRPMEVEAILGNVVKIGRRHQLAIPHIQALYALLQLKDVHNRQQKIPS